MPLKTISEVSGQKENSSVYDSGRRSLLERSVQQRIDEESGPNFLLRYNQDENPILHEDIEETNEDIDEREMSSRSPLKGLSH